VKRGRQLVQPCVQPQADPAAPPQWEREDG
jgi:hypothetical protein